MVEHQMQVILRKKIQMEYLVKLNDLSDTEANWEFVRVLLAFTDQIEAYLEEKSMSASTN